MTEREKESIIEKARELGEKYLEKYGGCAQATFASVANGPGLEYGEDTFQSLVGLSGGIGALGTGSCGAAAGAGAAISLSFGIGPSDLEKDEDLRWNVYYGVAGCHLIFSTGERTKNLMKYRSVKRSSPMRRYGRPRPSSIGGEIRSERSSSKG